MQVFVLWDEYGQLDGSIVGVFSSLDAALECATEMQKQSRYMPLTNLRDFIDEFTLDKTESF